MSSEKENIYASEAVTNAAEAKRRHELVEAQQARPCHFAAIKQEKDVHMHARTQTPMLQRACHRGAHVLMQGNILCVFREQACMRLCLMTHERRPIIEWTSEFRKQPYVSL